MAGDVKLSQRATTSTRSDTDFKHVARYSGGVYTDYKIARTVDEADIYTALGTKKIGVILRLYSQGATFTQPFDADTEIEKITIRYVSGTPLLKIGETLGGDEVMPEDTVVTGTDYNIQWFKSYPSAQTLYFTLSGGVVHIAIDYVIDKIGTP